MGTLYTIITFFIMPIICSVLAAFVFWTLSFRAPTTKIVFSPKLERSFRDNKYRLRIRFINTGPADLYDIRYIARLSYKPKNAKGAVEARKTVAYINVGQRSSSPVLYGKKVQKQKRNIVLCWTATLIESEDFYSTFSRWYNPDHIIEKAKAKTLTFDHVLEEYKESVKFKIFAFGIDSMTGIEKMFASCDYAHEDIITGKFNPAHVIINRYSDYVNYILSVKESEPGNISQIEYSSVPDYEEQCDELDDEYYDSSLNTVHDNNVTIDGLIQNTTREIRELENILQIKREEMEALQAIRNKTNNKKKSNETN